MSQPISTGLMKDPRPSRLVIAPNPPDAAEPASSVVGIDQKGPVNEKVALAMIVIARMESQGLCEIQGMQHQPSAATSSGPAACQRRSPDWSEWRALKYCTKIAKPLGIADSRPMTRISVMPVSRMIEGSQRPIADVPTEPETA